jgi:DNA-binding NtrC family response regulator
MNSANAANADSIPVATTILVADDEPFICDLISTVLGAEGIQTRCYANGAEVLDCLENDGNITAVLLDRFMPIMSGDEAFQRIRDLRPDLPVIIMSGMDPFCTMRPFDITEPQCYMQKPFTCGDLTDSVHRVLPQTMG